MANLQNLPKPEIKQLGIKAKNGMKIIQATFKGRNFTREEIQYLCQKLGKELGAKVNGRIHVSLPYPKGWRSGGWTELGAPVKLWTEKEYNLEDPPTYS